jgi:hypothetical protein
LIIRAISEAELGPFGIFADEQGAELGSQLKDAWRTGKTRAEWCLVAAHAGGWAGRVLLSASPATPIFIHFFDVDWSRDDADAIARDLIEAAIDAAKREAERDLLYASTYRIHGTRSQIAVGGYSPRPGSRCARGVALAVAARQAGARRRSPVNVQNDR